MTSKKSVPAKKSTLLKKRATTKESPANSKKAVAQLFFERIHVASFRQMRALLSRCAKEILNGRLDLNCAKTAIIFLDRILAINHAILLQSQLQKLKESLSIPDLDEEEEIPPDEGEIENNPDELIPPDPEEEE